MSAKVYKFPEKPITVESFTRSFREWLEGEAAWMESEGFTDAAAYLRRKYLNAPKSESEQ